jgi:hypothetical protein
MPEAMTSAPTSTSVRFRTARPGDGDTVVELMSLVDLHWPADQVSAALAPMRQALTQETAGPLSHGPNRFLIAEDTGGTPVGVVVCGPARRLLTDPRIPHFTRRRLVHRVSAVHGLAVRPEHRSWPGNAGGGRASDHPSKIPDRVVHSVSGTGPGQLGRLPRGPRRRGNPQHAVASADHRSSP